MSIIEARSEDATRAKRNALETGAERKPDCCILVVNLVGDTPKASPRGVQRFNDSCGRGWFL